MAPFSGKKKKEQLKARRARKHEKNEHERAREAALTAQQECHDGETGDGGLPSLGTEYHRYSADHTHAITSVFAKESTNELNARRQANYRPLAHRSMMPATGIPFGSWFDTHMDAAPGSTHASDDMIHFPLSVEIPTRGWSLDEAEAEAEAASCSSATNDSDHDEDNEAHKLSRRGARRDRGGAVDADTAPAAQEDRFARYIHTLEHNLHDPSHTPLPLPLRRLPCTLYERNIEVWRQLWRTVEYSDVVVLVTDARYPVVHLHVGLLSYIVRDEGKPCVIVLNKTDLVPSSTTQAWMKFLTQHLRRLGLMAWCDTHDHRCTTATTAPAQGGCVDAAAQTEDDKAQTSAQMESQTQAVHRCGPDSSPHAASRVAPIVLRTFTAQPQAETESGVTDTVTVDKRRGKKRQQRGKRYAQLRSGSVSAPHAPAGSDGCAAELYSDRDGDGEEDDEGEAHDAEERASTKTGHPQSTLWGYGPHECFHGRARAQSALQQDVPRHSELKAVSLNIAELLELCRTLAAHRRGEPTMPDSRRSDTHVPTRRTDGNAHVAASCDEVDAMRGEPTRIAFVGFPNVGKSTLLNCISGGNVVSVSATAGHTKHLQTIPLPHDHVVLVDSPGLTLPLLGMPRPLQAVIGTHQIAQTRDPQSGVAFLATHLPLEKLYGLTPLLPREEEWSAYDFCEAYARKRGFYVKRGKGSVDTHRAAIALLQEAYEGRLVLFFAPPPLSFLDSSAYATWVQAYSIVPVLASTSTQPASGSDDGDGSEGDSTGECTPVEEGCRRCIAQMMRRGHA